MNQQLTEQLKHFNDLWKALQQKGGQQVSTRTYSESLADFHVLMNTGGTFGPVQSSLYIHKVALIEVFLSTLTRRLYRDGHLRSEDKVPDGGLSLDELRKLKNLEEALDSLIERRVIAFSFRTVRDQFKALKLGKKSVLDFADDELVGRYIEALERRHVLTHNDGLVSRRYLAKLREEKHWRDREAELPKVGEKLKFYEGFYGGGAGSLIAAMTLIFQVVARSLARSQGELNWCGAKLNVAYERLVDAWDLEAIVMLGQTMDRLCQTYAEDTAIGRQGILWRAFIASIYEKPHEVAQLLARFSWQDAPQRELVFRHTVLGEYEQALKVVEEAGATAVQINEFREHRVFKTLLSKTANAGSVFKEVYGAEACAVVGAGFRKDGEPNLAKKLE